MQLALSDLAVTEISDGQILAYSAALAFSGLLLVIVAATGFGTPGIGTRILTAVIGLAMLGYAFYLLFIAGPGDSVYVFWYVLVVPVLLIIQAVKHVRARRA